MEHHHLSASFTLLQDPALDFLDGMSVKSRTAFRKQVIEAVLATDMKQHFSLVSLFNTKFSAPAPAAAAAEGGSKGRASGGSKGANRSKGEGSRSGAGGHAGLDPVKMDDEMRSLVMQVRSREGGVNCLGSQPAADLAFFILEHDA